MARNEAGKCVLRDGGDILTALERLARYEEVTEITGIEDPDELGRLISGMMADTTANQRKLWRRDGVCPAPGKGVLPAIRHCEDCGHYQPEAPGARAGICDAHPRKVRPGGGKRGSFQPVPGEHRRVVARRVACGDWTRREEKEKEGQG